MVPSLGTNVLTILFQIRVVIGCSVPVVASREVAGALVGATRGDVGTFVDEAAGDDAVGDGPSDEEGLDADAARRDPVELVRCCVDILPREILAYQMIQQTPPVSSIRLTQPPPSRQAQSARRDQVPNNNSNNNTSAQPAPAQAPVGITAAHSEGEAAAAAAAAD